MTRILIAEDDQDLRAVLRMFLESAGYAVEAVPDGEKAIRAQQERPADVLVTDIFMPDRDGLETLEYFRTHHPGVPIIAISGRKEGHQTDHLAVAKYAGADAVLRKPFEIGQLMERLQVLVPGDGQPGQ